MNAQHTPQPSWLDGGVEAVAMAIEDRLLPASEITPGPWEVDEMLTVNAPSTLMVAECSCAASRPLWGGSDFSTRAHQEANARAIRAVPELLEIVRISIGNVRSLGPAGAIEPYTDYRVWLEQLEAAYDKATRSTP